MAVLFQINECLNFSTGKIAQQIGEAAIAEQWESWIAYSSRETYSESKSHVLRVGSTIDPYIHYIESRLFDREGLSSRLSTKQLVERIRMISPDIVHLHNIHDHWLNYKILFEYLNNTNIRVVWTFHDCWAFTGHCFHFVTKGCERWKSQCNNCPLQREYPKSYKDRSLKNYELKKQLFSANKNLTIVACSDWMASLVRKSFLKELRIEVINNGIDLNVFRPLEEKISDRKFQILAVSNVWNKEKGYYDILELRSMLPTEYEIIIVGLTAEQLRQLPDGIRGIERTQDVQELVGLYSSADVLINPTYADTFPTINIEALACGTPVITYKTGGSPEIIDDNTGIVVEQGNVLQMAKAIKTIKENPIEPDLCRDRAVSLFDKDKCFVKYIDLYNSLI